jgi:hypothetical protein
MFLKIFSRKFKEYSKNISQKIITKAIKKQAGVACVIPFSPTFIFNASKKNCV